MGYQWYIFKPPNPPSERAVTGTFSLRLLHCEFIICDQASIEQHPGDETGLARIAGEFDCPLICKLPDDGGKWPAKLLSNTEDISEHLQELNRELRSVNTDNFYFVETLDKLQTLTGLPEENETLAAASQNILPLFAMAEKKASRFQKLFFKAGKTAFLCSFLASASVALGVVFFHAHWLFFGLELLFLITALATIKHAEHIRSHKSWLTYRYLAERLRTALFLAICGIRLKPYLPVRHGEVEPGLGWVLRPLLWVHRSLPAMKWDQGGLDALYAFITEKWLDHQIQHHRDKHTLTEAKVEQLEHYGQGLFLLALIFAAAHLAIAFVIPALHHTLADSLLTLMALVLPAAAAGLAGFIYHRDFKKISSNSQKMASDLARFMQEFNPITLQEFQEDVVKLAGLMQDESSRWLNLLVSSELHPEA
jgi:hypothetical protein